MTFHTENRHKAIKTARMSQRLVPISKTYFHDMEIVIHTDTGSISENILELIDSYIMYHTFHNKFIYQKNITD
jgi:hypothetical protein